MVLAHVVEGQDTCAHGKSLAALPPPPRASASLLSQFLFFIRFFGSSEKERLEGCAAIQLLFGGSSQAGWEGTQLCCSGSTCTALALWEPGHRGALPLLPSWTEV